MARRQGTGGGGDVPADEPGFLTLTVVAVVLFLSLAGLGALIVQGVATGFDVASAFGWAGQAAVALGLGVAVIGWTLGAVALFVLLFGRRPDPRGR